MGTKRRGSELDHEAKKTKSDNSKSDDEVSSSNSVHTTPALPRQPITDLNKLPQTARKQFNFLLQALSDVSPESLYEVNILHQINAINSNVGRPIFTYKPPDITVLFGHEHKIDDAHDCVKTGCTEFYVKVKSRPYANGYFSVEVEKLGMITGDGYFFPYCDENHGGLTFTETLWKDNYLLEVQSRARKAIVSYNREVLGYWVRKIAHAEIPLSHFERREQARGEFLSGHVVWTTASRDTWGFHGNLVGNVGVFACLI